MEIGLFGKLPSHGDFLRRRVSDAFVEAWDGWLQRGIAESRAALGDRWLDVYLTSPAWRFAAAAGVCGAAPVLGLMVPSVDRVGRYFPLTIVSELPANVNLIAAATKTHAFYGRAEQLLVETLAEEVVDFEAFDAQVVGLERELCWLSAPAMVVLDGSAAAILTDSAGANWQVPIGGLDHLEPVLEQLLQFALTGHYNRLMLWWTEGSAMVEPTCLVANGLPDPTGFVGLLDGCWTDHHWVSATAHIDPALDVRTGDEPLVERPPLRMQSAAATDQGKIREINQDAFLERPEVGVWAVADGLGGHRDGEIASRMVCDALADFEPNATFEDMLGRARERLQQVNDHIYRVAARTRLTDLSGSTVVTLLVRGSRCAVLWAGDSRVYRWRGGRLERLTRDHSLAESGSRFAPHQANIVTRAIGVETELKLDVHRDEVHPGDRFLLCSDGLTHTLADSSIAALIGVGDIRAVVDGLIDATLDAGAPDNVTVLIVEATGLAPAAPALGT